MQHFWVESHWKAGEPSVIDVISREGDLPQGSCKSL